MSSKRRKDPLSPRKSKRAASAAPSDFAAPSDLLAALKSIRVDLKESLGTFSQQADAASQANASSNFFFFKKNI